MSFPGYESYKDSGVESLGKVPRHWTAVPLKRIVDQSRPITYGIVQCGPHVSGGIPYIRPTDMLDEAGVANEEGLLKTSEEIASSYARSTLQRGDLVCSIGPSFGKVMIVPQSLVGANLTQGTARIAVAKEHIPRFFFWVLRSTPSFHQWESSVGGATFRALNLEPLSETIVCVPSLDEQAAIAAFLDRETVKIDALVDEQRRLVELLKEKRRAVVSHAVTKGLDPNTPMKDSGVEWLGEVPVHWEIATLKRHWHVTDCKHITAEFVDEGVPLASIREAQSRFVDLQYAKQTTDSYYEQLVEGGRKPQPGDLIFTRNATVGEVAQVADWHPAFAMGQDVCLLRKSRPELSSDYLWYVLRSDCVISQLANLMIGSTFKRVNVEEVRNLVVLVPNATEQAEIATFLDQVLLKMNALVAESEAAVTLLQERRAALISAAVTGKIDVRGRVKADGPVPKVVAA
ncbi:type I restriction enzyme S subunit [Bradyrhizobium sp. AZCC 1588]|uniref:restriction endonuclease subunit S n=1 Tax=unclassified Bradyrhizobium TaxID=2631580 RepID=UPI002FF02725